MSKHTPGPWSVETVRTSIGRCHKILPFRACVYEDSTFDLKCETEAMANARLIAAAPELLDVLKSFPGFTDDATIGDPWIERKAAAIAKAEGK